MKKLLLTIIGVFLFVNYAYPQSSDKKYDSRSTSLVGGRYEIITSDIRASCSFKVDKHLGDVYQLVKNSKEEMVWEKMYKNASPNDIRIEGVNYQLYTSGIALRYTFLMNINTGVTWQLSTGISDWWMLMPE